MSHYAVVAPPLYSHVKALQALAVQLIERGHRVTFVQQFEARSLLDDPRIGFYPLGETRLAPGSLARTLALAAHPSGLGLFRLIDDLAATTDMLCAELPAALEALKIDGLIVDQMEAAGGLVADALDLPYVSIACALPVNREPGLPLPVMPFGYSTSARARHRYDASEKIYDWLMRRHARVIEHHARRLGLAPRRSLHECLSTLAQISQTPASLDFPRSALPACFHAVGPLRNERSSHCPKAPGVMPPKPFVFASLGTLQGHRYPLFCKIAKACQRLEMPLLIAHCGGLDAAQAARLERHGTTWVTDFADQPVVLAKARAVITHGGLNTVVDAIHSATPMLAVPLAFDQPGVAARIEHHGIGQRVSRFARSTTFAKHLSGLLNDDIYRLRLRTMHPTLAQAGGAARAARIAEKALGERRPVLAEAA
ncbi:glycosyltransferase family 1 protein [Halomonas aquamarina]|uniref:Glycosyltransferase family 1 protein n=1 Tax=Vreelandella aquamarina TaxID=77097 RepID=A0ACC5VQR9_9GAMM|nr:glycosyltransferase [Halomonas aquamarina]MBZ5485997.1 glycosyltransferase family 1 protein [Halomonas aquamarina]